MNKQLHILYARLTIDNRSAIVNYQIIIYLYYIFDIINCNLQIINYHTVASSQYSVIVIQ